MHQWASHALSIAQLKWVSLRKHLKPPETSRRVIKTGVEETPAGGHHNNNHNYQNHTNNFSNARAPNTNNNNTNTAPRTGSNAIPVATKDKTTITCYECGVTGHYSNECPKRLAKLAVQQLSPTAACLAKPYGRKSYPLVVGSGRKPSLRPDVLRSGREGAQDPYLKTAQSREKSYADKTPRDDL
ncbi:hypothetical protein QYE76_064320 [Lolium multiflorum]|uniref:CCHC-type domain-containing protein n=1 Tax=Lolium multiflorum TaxID=4521 RepID=A0AAD8S8P8_LOLMU|nr:hypothetical protein QYE76_064320 [Lolium multiflorum]